jgi:hypothetical protein
VIFSEGCCASRNGDTDPISEANLAERLMRECSLPAKELVAIVRARLEPNSRGMAENHVALVLKRTAP